MDSPGGSTVGALASVRSRFIFQRLLSEAAAGLTFSPDANRDLTADGVLYSRADHSHLFRPTGVLTPAAKTGFYRPAPRQKHRQAPQGLLQPGWLPWTLHPSESANHPQVQRQRLLQDSCKGTRVKPAHKVAPDSRVTFRDSESSRHVLQRQHSTLTTTHTDEKSVTTESLDQDQDQVPTKQPQSDSGGSGADRFTDAAQNVVLHGDHSREVIQRLLAQVFHDDKPGDTQHQPPDVHFVVSQLIILSKQTTQVRSLLAEQLNSPESESRLLACNTLCSLRGQVNKDVVHKLSQLMSSDPSEQVRLAAAQTLLKLGKVLDVHHQLRLKLEGVCGPQGRMAGLELISSLRLTTAKLLQPLVSCFRDESSAVRRLACEAAAALLLKDETVESCLLELVETDPVQDVRLSAIRAVGVLGLSSADVQEALQSCMETGQEAEVRVAACKLLPSAGMPMDKLQNFLLQRLSDETDWLVRRAIKEMLQEDQDGDTQFIRLQVKRQCEWRLVADRVLLLEKLQAEKPAWFGLQPRVIARLLSLHQQAEPPETTDRH